MHCVENSLWKRLWTCHKAEQRMILDLWMRGSLASKARHIHRSWIKKKKQDSRLWNGVENIFTKQVVGNKKRVALRQRGLQWRENSKP